MNNVRPPTHTVMTEHGSKKQLHIENEDGQKRQREQAGAALIELHARLLLDPLLASEHSHSGGDTEESLGQRGVGGGDWWRQEEEYRQSAQDSLGDDRAHCTDREKPQPAPLLGAPGPDGQDNRQQSRALRDHAVRVFELHSTDELRDLVPGSK